jgi:DnaJ-class molecular chaperone
MDYYQILQLDSKTANSEHIAEAFRRLSVQSHPLRQKEIQNKEMVAFNQICESYEVLSDPRLKKQYDVHGHRGLSNIGSKKDGRFQEGYSFNGDSFAIYQKFFGISSPLVNNFDKHQPPSQAVEDDENAPKDLDVRLKCSLYEFYNGSLKECKYKRMKLLLDERTQIEVEESFAIELKVGDSE